MLILFLRRPPAAALLLFGPLSRPDCRFLWRILFFLRLLRNNLTVSDCAEDILQKRKRLRAAHFKSIFTFAAEHIHHLIGHIVQLVVCDSHFLHQVADRFKPQFLGAPQTQPLINCFISFKPRHKNNGKTFLAS